MPMIGGWRGGGRGGEAFAEKSRLLDAKLAAARRLERRRLLLERHAADLASRALAARADIDVARAHRLAVARDLANSVVSRCSRDKFHV
ncbi:hypothetical protein ABZP36_019806 [Zizania latifolia]